MTETLFTVLLLLCALAITRLLGRACIRTAALAGLWCGVAILTRPIALFLPLFLGPLLVALAHVTRNRSRIFGAVVLVVVAALLPVGWTVRNYVVAGVAQPTHRSQSTAITTGRPWSRREPRAYP